MGKSIFLGALFLCCFVGFVVPHEDNSAGTCESNEGVRIRANYNPGLVTLDGHPDEWPQVDGFDFSLLPALDPDADHAYKDGKLTVKALHDGQNVFFLLQVSGVYAYSKGESNKCPSISLMFQVGENASYHSMGGCKESQSTCSRKTCRGHEVDIMHFSIGSAVPGRLYGGNPTDIGNGGDRYGHLVDLYAWTPHCRFLDGTSPAGNDTSAQNDWKGAWWHDNFNVHSGFVEEDSPYATIGQKGIYTFEFSRPLRTTDRFQQDVQFTIGQSSKMAVAFWYPVDGNPWHGSQHYSINCDWVPLDIVESDGILSRSNSTSLWDLTTAFSLLLSVISFCISVFIGYWVSRIKSVSFTPIDRL